MRKVLCFLVVFIMACMYLYSKPNPYKVIVVLLDLSESTNKPDIRTLYINSFKKVLNRISNGDSLFVAPITEKSILELNFIVEESNIAPSKVTFDTNLRLRRKLEKDAAEELKRKKEEIYKRVEEILSRQIRKVYRTDILSSLNMVDERIFRTHDDQKYIKMLVIMSDMVEDSEVYNFEKQPLNMSKIGEIIQKRKEINLIPNLINVKIYIVGANAISVEKYNDIKKFWYLYFKESGALLLEENYSSSCPIRICE